MASSTMEAFLAAGLLPLPSKPVEENDFNITLTAILKDLHPILNDGAAETKTEEKRIGEAIVRLTPYPTLIELKSMIDAQKPDGPLNIEAPSIAPLEMFLKKRATTIDGLKKLRASMTKHIINCKISNTVGDSASIIGGILCFFFPLVGVPVLLAGSATSLGSMITENAFERRLRKKYTDMLEEDASAMKICESNIKEITAWLVTVYSFGCSVSEAGVDFIQLAQAIQATSTLGAWSELVGQLPSLAGALATGAQTVATISGQILGVSVIISVADLIQTWVSKDATLEAIDKDVALLEQQLTELKRIAEAYHT